MSKDVVVAVAGASDSFGILAGQFAVKSHDGRALGHGLGDARLLLVRERWRVNYRFRVVC